MPKLPPLKVKNDLRKASHPIHPHSPGDDIPMATESSLQALAASASASEMVLEDSQETATAKAKRHYIRTLHKVIEQSDVVILVLDARDPEGCRSKLVEEEVRRREGDGKKLVFVLNKIGASFVHPSFFLTLLPQTSSLKKMPSPGSATSVIQHPPSPSVPPPNNNPPTSPPKPPPLLSTSSNPIKMAPPHGSLSVSWATRMSGRAV